MNNEPVAWIMWVGEPLGYINPSTVKEELDEDLEHFKQFGVNDHKVVPLYTHPVKELTDEEINKLWAESHEDGIAMQQGFTTQQHYFASLILRKARND